MPRQTKNSRASANKLVVDTNVLVSGLIWGGVPGRIVERITDGGCELATSRSLLNEFSSVLDYPKFRSALAHTQVSRWEAFFGVLETVTIVTPARRVRLIPDEPVDNELIAVALTVGADAIVSGDRHLLDLGTVKGIPILTPREFLRRFQAR